ncbi:MAG: limonene-1,2-epoxide hydrolase family protein [Dehalococcoidia bacterium]
MSENKQTVLNFIEAWNSGDAENILDFLHTDCVFHCMPLAPARGIDAIRRMIRIVLEPAGKVDWVLHNIAESPEGVVFTERTDRYLIDNKWIEHPVTGVFELIGGRIVSWRDYFDLNYFEDQIPAEHSED